MRVLCWAAFLMLVLFGLACADESPTPTDPAAVITVDANKAHDEDDDGDEDDEGDEDDDGDDDGRSATVSGRGDYVVDLGGGVVLDGELSLVGVLRPNGRASGRFHHRLDLDGELADFRGRITCLSFDAVNKRAWIGGVVTKNKSTPGSGLREDIHERGRDIWFRVVDYGGRNAEQPDRTTFVGFEGAAGIITSEEYCEARIWPDNDERTWPVTGKIRVRP